MGHRHVRVRRDPDKYAYLPEVQGRIQKYEALMTRRGSHENLIPGGRPRVACPPLGEQDDETPPA